MKKLFPLLLCFGFLIPQAPAQPAQRCGTDAYHILLDQKDPSYAVRRQAYYQQALEYASTAGTESTVIVTIPVVAHVVWNTAAQNISNAQVVAQIAQLNLDYAAGNPDTATIPSVFKQVLGNADIQFCLASRDPNNQSTNGILHVNTNIPVFNSSHPSQESPAWDSNRYLNMWICNLPGNTLGYAQFPGGNASTDGVVLNYRTVGSAQMPSAFPWSVGTNYNWGRTATHEIGHWLGLLHTFEGGCHTNCATQGDLICDTPPVSGPSFGCPSFPKISCSNGPNGGMFMNFMDYADDDCMKLFTVQQAGVMGGIINSARVLLQTSQGCVPVGIGETRALKNVTVYFNPVSSSLMIVHQGIFSGTVTLHDMLGKQVFGKLLQPQETVIRSYGLAPGVYMVRINTTDGQVTRKVLVQ